MSDEEEKTTWGSGQPTISAQNTTGSGGGHNWTEAVQVGNWRFSPPLNSAARALEITLFASDNRENAELLWKINLKPEKQ